MGGGRAAALASPEGQRQGLDLREPQNPVLLCTRSLCPGGVHISPPVSEQGGCNLPRTLTLHIPLTSSVAGGGGQRDEVHPSSLGKPWKDKGKQAMAVSLSPPTPDPGGGFPLQGRACGVRDRTEVSLALV